jgi:hypothetical protein
LGSDRFYFFLLVGYRIALTGAGMVYVINTCGLKEFIQLSKWKGQTPEQAKTDLLDSEAVN